MCNVVERAETPRAAIHKHRLLQRRRGRQFGDSERRVAYGFVLPVVVVILAVAIYPLGYAILLSFRSVRFNVPTGWVGTRNYADLFGDSTFWDALSNTALFTSVSVTLEFFLGLAIALLINRPFRGRALVRAAILVPWAFPTVISAVMWRLMFQDQVGIVDYAANALNLVDRPILTDETLTLIAAIFISTWKTTPFMALLLLAGLQSIPDDVYESARVDGASALQRFTSITLPLLKPAILVALLFRTLDAWRVFELFYVFTGARLDSLSTYVYEAVRVSELRFAIGNAAAVFVFASAMAIATVFVKVLGVRTPAEDS